jgi:hypothetical protein
MLEGSPATDDFVRTFDRLMEATLILSDYDVVMTFLKFVVKYGFNPESKIAIGACIPI